MACAHQHIPTGHRIWIWYLRALQAEALALTGELQRAQELIDESLEQLGQGEERADYAEVLRLKGWVLIQQGDFDAAEKSLRTAIEVARAQQARSWELRAATTLARLLADQGDGSSARALLSPIYGWFTEGFETKDLRAAKALLDRIQTASIASQ
jgi:predicted ATPase